jgi:hypothetical protein
MSLPQWMFGGVQPVGKPSQVPARPKLPPGWLSNPAVSSQMAQQNVAQMNAQWASVRQTAALPTTVDNPVHNAMNAKLFKLSTQLPMRLILQIKSVNLYNDPMRIEVLYMNDHVLVIPDVDAFPSEEHIARIALECP